MSHERQPSLETKPKKLSRVGNKIGSFIARLPQNIVALGILSTPVIIASAAVSSIISSERDLDERIKSAAYEVQHNGAAIADGETIEDIPVLYSESTESSEFMEPCATCEDLSMEPGRAYSLEYDEISSQGLTFDPVLQMPLGDSGDNSIVISGLGEDCEVVVATNDSQRKRIELSMERVEDECVLSVDLRDTSADDFGNLYLSLPSE